VISSHPWGEDGVRAEDPNLDSDLTVAATHPSREAAVAQIGRISTRYRAGFAYLDAVLPDGETLKLCRLRHGGSARQWGFAIYRASHDDYEDSYLPTGYPVGTCEQALDTACGLYLNDPTAWLQPPTNQQA
jgi:hypothetical protein